MSPQLDAFGQDLERTLTRRPTPTENVSGAVRPLQRIAQAMTGKTLRKNTQQKGLGGTAVSTLLAKHRGPIVFLGTNGLPEFYFEQHEDQWQAYYGGDRRACEPNRSPDDVLQSYLQRPGTIFNVLHGPLADTPESAPVSPDDLLVIEPEDQDSGDSGPSRSEPPPGRQSSRRGGDVRDGDESDGETQRFATSRTLTRSRPEPHPLLAPEGSDNEDAPAHSANAALTEKKTRSVDSDSRGVQAPAESLESHGPETGPGLRGEASITATATSPSVDKVQS